ncbi:P-type conjugative transfer ATPase TrbB [Aquidulcibacter paucihalophilus]|uniref:P-type conjugative transfer ATPase TrbB n=1 Tax=Aquidulcibacter paucihalophilus TaxID=1978549 RepID=UPI000A18C51C|nr:P-type conjugative transfer ATPase TrbB [Aquidulcibacter paucihalophilus]
MAKLGDHPIIAERRLEALRHALGPEVLAALIDPDVVEILANPDGQLILDKIGSGRAPTNQTLSPESRDRVIRLIADYVGEPVLPEDPRLSGILPETGERFQGVLPPVSRAPAFSIRKRPARIFTLGDYQAQGILGHEQRILIEQAAKERHNILISGGTSSGKTTLANAILALPAFVYTRTILIEDTPELQCSAWDQVALLTRRTPKVIGVVDLVRDSLRLRPDRIVVGEMRDGAAALETLKAWNTGHPGGLSTIHANSAKDALSRLEDLTGEVAASIPRRAIGQAIDLVIHIARTREGRRVEDLIEVRGEEEGAYHTRKIG